MCKQKTTVGRVASDPADLQRLEYELAIVRQERDTLQEQWSQLGRVTPKHRTFRFIKDHRDEFPVKHMCRALGVSPSGYYAWQGRRPSK